MKLLPLFCLAILFSLEASAYTLNLKPKKWDLNAAAFVIIEVDDQRPEKNNGTILSNGQQENIGFTNGPESDLLDFIRLSAEADTGAFPVVLGMKEFRFSESGNMMRHTIRLKYTLTFYSVVNGNRYELYEVSGTPEMVVTGIVARAYETIVENALQKSIENFGEWFKGNRTIAQLTRHVKIIPDKSPGFEAMEKRDTVLWCPNEYRLSWKDFKGKPPVSDYSAQSNCMFLFTARSEAKEDTLYLYIQLSACLSRLSSWVKNGVTSDSLLAHEQLHFDICELNIRQLRKKLMEMVLDPMQYQKQIQPVFNDTWIAYQEQQALYDEETQHGLVPEEQVRWRKEIETRLRTMSAFAVPSCD